MPARDAVCSRAWIYRFHWFALFRYWRSARGIAFPTVLGRRLLLNWVSSMNGEGMARVMSSGAVFMDVNAIAGVGPTR